MVDDASVDVDRKQRLRRAGMKREIEKKITVWLRADVAKCAYLSAGWHGGKVSTLGRFRRLLVRCTRCCRRVLNMCSVRQRFGFASRLSAALSSTYAAGEEVFVPIIRSVDRLDQFCGNSTPQSQSELERGSQRSQRYGKRRVCKSLSR